MGEREQQNKHEATFHLVYSVYLIVHMHRFDFMGSNIQTTEKCRAVICIVMCCIVIHRKP